MIMKTNISELSVGEINALKSKLSNMLKQARNDYNEQHAIADNLLLRLNGFNLEDMIFKFNTYYYVSEFDFADKDEKRCLFRLVEECKKDIGNIEYNKQLKEYKKVEEAYNNTRHNMSVLKQNIVEITDGLDSIKKAIKQQINNSITPNAPCQ